ncbi:MAG: helix-turn-helix transcriptional regulator [Deltaproteobacteria bacterium]|nr:helix-turn-helix transcriptional regulator [Deltaproteobacteria bacterium]
MTTKIKKSQARDFLEKLTGGALTFGRRLTAIRLGEEESQIVFAKRLKISPQHLCNIEKGLKIVSPERAAKFAKILGYSEKQFVRLALQDQLNKQGLDHLAVNVQAA